MICGSISVVILLYCFVELLLGFRISNRISRYIDNHEWAFVAIVVVIALVIILELWFRFY